eukprot:10434484-Ditylum_brightwellii.AAC.1
MVVQMRVQTELRSISYISHKLLIVVGQTKASETRLAMLVVKMIVYVMVMMVVQMIVQMELRSTLYILHKLPIVVGRRKASKTIMYQI